MGWGFRVSQGLGSGAQAFGLRGADEGFESLGIEHILKDLGLITVYLLEDSDFKQENCGATLHPKPFGSLDLQP